MEIGGTARDADIEQLPDQIAATGILDVDGFADVDGRLERQGHRRCIGPTAANLW